MFILSCAFDLTAPKSSDSSFDISERTSVASFLCLEEKTRNGFRVFEILLLKLKFGFFRDQNLFEPMLHQTIQPIAFMNFPENAQNKLACILFWRKFAHMSLFVMRQH